MIAHLKRFCPWFRIHIQRKQRYNKSLHTAKKTPLGTLSRMIMSWNSDPNPLSMSFLFSSPCSSLTKFSNLMTPGNSWQVYFCALRQNWAAQGSPAMDNLSLKAHYNHALRATHKVFFESNDLGGKKNHTRRYQTRVQKNIWKKDTGIRRDGTDFSQSEIPGEHRLQSVRWSHCWMTCLALV